MADGVWTFELCDQDDVLLDDITDLVTATISPRLNQPYSHVLNGPADTSVWKTAAADGIRALDVGIRTIKAKRNGVLIGNAEIIRLDYSGDANTQQVQISCFDPMWRTVGRRVSDSAARFAGWQFDDPISAGELVKQVFRNSITNDDDAVPFGTVRIFPIDCSVDANFTAVTDVSEELTDGPMSVNDLVYGRITDTGVADVMLTPTDTDAGSDPGIYGILHCVDTWGSDLSGTVHLDYDTGDRNVKAFRRSFDMGQVTNWLRYELGPTLGVDRWRGSLEAVDPLLLAITTAYRDNEAASRLKYGSLPLFEVFDSDANSARELYRALWKAEDTLRINPRQLMFLTPAADCEFEPFAGYNVGARIATNMSDNTGPAESGLIQRIYGFDLTVDVNGVEDPGEIGCSPDGASS
jgi:hypothetical protein